MLERGFFRALSAWREGALGTIPTLPRRAFAARSFLCRQRHAASEPVSGRRTHDELHLQELHSGRSHGGYLYLSFGFNILNERGQPDSLLSFRTRDDAAQARAEIAKAVAKAVEVTRPALTAAGEP